MRIEKVRLLASVLGVLLLTPVIALAEPLRADTVPTPEAAPAAQELPETLPPERFSGAVAESYGIARAIPDVLADLHCYCGCDRSMGHRHLLDCFADDHAAS